MTLNEYIDNLQANGQFWFVREQAQRALGCSKDALRGSIDRLTAKNKLVKLRQNFIIIVPLEYKKLGIIPNDWFLDPLMHHLEKPYYVGLLSAASLYGATHQKPQIFQVITNEQHKVLQRKRSAIVFYVNNCIDRVPTKKMQVSTGYINVSTPEATGLDLIKYYRSSGHLSNVATVLSELHEQMQEELILELAQQQIYSWSILQRFGYIMENKDVGGCHVVEKLAELIKKHSPRYVPLMAASSYDESIKDDKWRIFINLELEVDV